jgi:serine/threonine-protein kinase
MDEGTLSRTLLGHYRVETLIGRGGMGEVYRAHDLTLDRPVALKVLSQEFVGNEHSLSRFVQEARSASALNHPHVVAIYQIGRAVPIREGEPAGGAAEVQYIAMELVACEALRTLIDTRRLDSKRTLDIAQAATRSPRRTPPASCIATSNPTT